MSESKRIIVDFKAEYRLDGGFRVYAIEPTGLYVSSESTYAAAEYFQNLSPCVVVDHERAQRGDGVALVTPFDWPQIAAEGKGRCIFEVLAREEMEEELGPEEAKRVRRKEDDFPTPAGQEAEVAEIGLNVVARKIGSKTIVVVNDPGESDPVLEQLIKQYEHQQ